MLLVHTRGAETRDVRRARCVGGAVLDFLSETRTETLTLSALRVALALRVTEARLSSQARLAETRLASEAGLAETRLSSVALGLAGKTLSLSWLNEGEALVGLAGDVRLVRADDRLLVVAVNQLLASVLAVPVRAVQALRGETARTDAAGDTSR